MQIASVEGDLQIGGGSGWVAGRLGEGLSATRTALQAAGSDWSRPVVGKPHPREAALAASREAVIRLNEALSVEAPEDAVEDTRHALEELTGAMTALESGDAHASQTRFEQAVELLVRAEWRLTNKAWGFG